MDSDRLNRWLTLAANFGVVAGIIFLAIEVRQNQEILDRNHEIALLDSASLAVSRYTALREMRIQSREVAQLWMDGLDGKELDPVDQYRFNSMCQESIGSAALSYQRSVALGEITSQTAAVAGAQNGIEKYAGFAACWESERKALRVWGYEDFVNAVDSK